MPHDLYPYQRDAVNSINDYFYRTGGNPLVVIPTGGGKSLIIGTYIKETVEEFPDIRIVCLAHVPELLSQNYAELVGFWPDAPAGIYSAKLNKRNIHAKILYAGIQSIHRKAYNLQKVDMVLVDEAHLIPRSSNTMYRRFISELLQINPRLKVVGFTATEFRLDSGMLHTGDNAIFDDVCYNINIRDLINGGYLSLPVSKSATSQIDTSHVGTAGGEFVQRQLQAAANDPEAVNAIADEILSNSESRQGILVFGCGVEHATMLRDALRERGISCEAVFGDTPNTERTQVINMFKQRRIRALASMGVLTTGFNARHVDMIALARATKSRGLYIQIVGRGTRLYPGKKDCLVLDFGGNIQRHGPIDELKPLKEFKDKDKDNPNDAPTKECPYCQSECAISARECETCGYEFPIPEAKIETEASTLSIMSDISERPDMSPQWLDVTKVYYSRHKKDGSPDSLKVTYMCGLIQYSEWVCIEHPGLAGNKAKAWLRKRLTSDVQIPISVGYALEIAKHNTMSEPKQIAVQPNGKFNNIVGYRDFVSVNERV